MFKSPKRVFILLIILSFLLILIDLPERYPVKFSLFGYSVDTIISPVSINLSKIGIAFEKKFSTHLGLDLSGGTHIALSADMSDIKSSERDNALESTKQVIERRVNFFGVSEPTVQTAKSKDSYRIIVELPGITDVDAAVSVLGQTAKLEFREFIIEPSATDSGLSVLPLLQTTKSLDITGKDLMRAALSFSSETGEPQVAIEFTSEGGKKFADATTRLIGKRLPIFLDSTALTWPTVRTIISDGQGVISGGFTREGAKMLALQLNAGALPVPVSIIEKRTVGATLGAISVAKSVQAGFIGLIIVAIFMTVQYGKLGLLADFALILYGLITFAIFRWIPITLTLPGIAGFILSIGMAVDSNILIFERFKEEKRSGKPWHIAMELGFGKAWDSIRDANVTTILTCIILYNPGNWSFLPSTGLVRGFAVTLFIGVLVSLFTGIIVTRTFVRVLYRENPKS
ncbi:protein translocase subunit SecD [Candidatus Gottesmanbacteria bacterium]|nr:protein translocase subunit SecD [Candidatus Gottesmanbacteria bacterium]